MGRGTKGMIHAVQKVFDLLKKVAFEESIGEGIDTVKREIENYPNETISVPWLKKGCIQHTYFFAEKSKGFGIAQLDEEKLLFTIGFDVIDAYPEYLNGVEVNSGIWVLLVSDLELKVHGSAIKIEEKILGGDGENDGMFSLNQLSEFFPEILLYAISEECPYEDFLPIFIDLLCENPSLLPFGLSTKLLTEVKAILPDLPPKIFPYENLLSLVWAANYKTAYLSLYHCVERLYQPWTMQSLFLRINCDIPFADFIESMDIENYRKPDDSSYEHLFKYIENSYDSLYLDALIIFREIKRESGISSIGKPFYEFRNNIVHLSFSSASRQRYEISENQWGALIASIVPMLKIWYMEIDKVFSESQS